MMKGKRSHSTSHPAQRCPTYVDSCVISLFKLGKQDVRLVRPEIQAALISQLSLHFRYRHFALGHAGKIHVMATGLNEKKKAYGVITSRLLEVYI